MFKWFWTIFPLGAPAVRRNMVDYKLKPSLIDSFTLLKTLQTKNKLKAIKTATKMTYFRENKRHKPFTEVCSRFKIPLAELQINTKIGHWKLRPWQLLL